MVSDSRGRYFQDWIDRQNQSYDFDYFLQSTVLPGRKLYDLWVYTRPLLLRNEIDFAFLMGGICDITTRIYLGGHRCFWPDKSIYTIMNNLIQSMIDISEEVKALGLIGKVAFLPEVGAALSIYNRVAQPTEWMVKYQDDLDRALPDLHNSTRHINSNIGSAPNWFLDTVYKRTKKGMWYARYNLLEDGLHPSRRTAERMIIAIRKDIEYNHLVLCIFIFLYIPCLNVHSGLVMDSSGLTTCFHFLGVMYLHILFLFSPFDIASTWCRHLTFFTCIREVCLWVGSSAPYHCLSTIYESSPNLPLFYKTSSLGYEPFTDLIMLQLDRTCFFSKMSQMTERTRLTLNTHIISVSSEVSSPQQLPGKPLEMKLVTHIHRKSLEIIMIEPALWT